MDTVANLRAFLAVARYGGFSEAARQLNVVPSVAAKRVSQLEHAIGTRLFERSTRKVDLTEAGQQFTQSARREPGTSVTSDLTFYARRAGAPWLCR